MVFRMSASGLSFQYCLFVVLCLFVVAVPCLFVCLRHGIQACGVKQLATLRTRVPAPPNRVRGYDSGL